MNLTDVKLDDLMSEINRRILAKGTVGEGVDYLTYALRQLPFEVLSAAVYSNEGTPNLKEEVQVNNENHIGTSVRSADLLREIINRASQKDDFESYIAAIVSGLSDVDARVFAEQFLSRFPELGTPQVAAVPSNYVNPDSLTGEQLVNMIATRISQRLADDESKAYEYGSYIKNLLGDFGVSDYFPVEDQASMRVDGGPGILEKINAQIEVCENEITVVKTEMADNLIKAYENPQAVTEDGYEESMGNLYDSIQTKKSVLKLLRGIIE